LNKKKLKDHENYNKRDFALITIMFLVKRKQTNKQTNKKNSIQYGKIKTSGIPLLNELFV